MIERAKNYFHGEEKYNCAQAVLAAYDAEHEKLADAKAFGGGRAPEGLCGAFHSAKELLGAEKFEEMLHEFKEAAGGLNCQEIRPLGKLSCRECVAFAAEKVQLHA
jgi:hypothetical protein